jgi:uncharacterized membrane protein YhhN
MDDISMGNIFGGLNIYPIIVFIIILAGREYFTARGNRFFKYLLTPLVTLSVLFAAFISFRQSGAGVYESFIFWGLLFSLVADVLLMIIEVRIFLHGLAFFLMAHVFYIGAFASRYEYMSWHLWIAPLLVIPMIFFFRAIREKAGKLAIPVLVYMLVITTMVFFAVTGIHDGVGNRACIAAAGAVLFMVSDLILAINEFLHELPHSSVIVWAVYAPAQMLLALSCG